jgi:predicted transposase/invertase (TIGR01784 family)
MGMGASRPPDPNNPHDALFRMTFSRVEHAAAEFRAVLPPAILARIDLATLVLESGSYVDGELASSESDLLFSVEVAGRRGLVYLLFEHQSSVDDLMPLRMLRYVVRILERHVSTAGGGKRALPLPLVLPVVLHHSAAGWSAATQIQALFDPQVVAEPTMAAHVPHFGFVLDDISRLRDDELTARALGALPTLALWALRDARHPGKVARSLHRWASLLRELAGAESGAEALITIFRYLSLVAEDLTPRTLLATLATADPKTRDTVMTTLAEQWKAEGRLEGKAEGRLEGKVEGARLVLLAQLELKFGTLPESVRERVGNATEAELSTWAARVLSAKSLEQLLT